MPSIYQNKKTYQIGRLLICWSFLVRLSGFQSSTYYGGLPTHVDFIQMNPNDRMNVAYRAEGRVRPSAL